MTIWIFVYRSSDVFVHRYTIKARADAMRAYLEAQGLPFEEHVIHSKITLPE